MKSPGDPIIERHRSRTLAWLLIGLLGIATGYDVYYMVTAPGYWHRLAGFAVIRDLFLVFLLAVNRSGWSRGVAAGAVVLVPVAVGIRLFAGLAPVPTRTLSFLILDLVLASLLFSVRGTVIVAALNVALMVAIGIVMPGLGVDTVLGPDMKGDQVCRELADTRQARESPGQRHSKRMK